MRDLLLVVCAIALVGCQSIETQRRLFIDYQNAEVGNPLYEEQSTNLREVRLSETESEFVPDSIPASGCAVAWTVDTHAKGPYHHPNGQVFTIEGIKKSWRFVGDSQKCQLKVGWFGPW